MVGGDANHGQENVETAAVNCYCKLLLQTATATATANCYCKLLLPTAAIPQTASNDDQDVSTSKYPIPAESFSQRRDGLLLL